MISKIANSRFSIFGLIGILFLLLQPVLNNQILTWDDVLYLTTNDAIKDLSFSGIIDMFKSQNKVMNVYNPLVLLTFAIEHHFVGLRPFLYHFDNLFLHLVNVWLVFIFIRTLSGNPLIALITALLFGIHPMHVESVAWISARKDVLFTPFFLSTLILYLRYIKVAASRYWIYIAAVACFMFSLLAKPAAVTLPIVLILVDRLIERKPNPAKYLDKLIFFVLALGAGLIALVGIDNSQLPAITILDRFALSGHALLLYLERLILPFNQAAIYAWPPLAFSIDPLGAYITSLLLLTLVIIYLFMWRKNKHLQFGLLFFVINITLVLHVIIPNSSVIYDRFTYIPYIGLFYIIGKYLADLIQNRTRVPKYMVQIIGYGMLIWVSYFGWQTNKRAKIWYDDMSLWTDVIWKYPNTPRAYSNRGDAYHALGRLNDAKNDYNLALHYDPKRTHVYNNRGIINKALKKYDEAMIDFNLAIQTDPEYAKAYYNRGNLYIKLKENEKAFADFNKAILLVPDYAEALDNRGFLYASVGRYDKALNDFNLAIEYNPLLEVVYFNRGLVYFKQGKYQDALNDMSSAIQLKPLYKRAIYRRSITYERLKQYDKALKDAHRAKSLGYKVDENYIKKLQELIKRSIN